MRNAPRLGGFESRRRRLRVERRAYRIATESLKWTSACKEASARLLLREGMSESTLKESRGKLYPHPITLPVKASLLLYGYRLPEAS